MREDFSRARRGRLFKRGELALLLVLGAATTSTAMLVGWLGLCGQTSTRPRALSVRDSSREHARMKVVTAHARQFERRFGFAPLSTQELVVTTGLAPALAQDGWDQPYRLRACGQVLYAFRCREGQALVSSLGPDGRVDTADDLCDFERGGD